ncbi:unnamed protein product [Paramecium primaurelia]|uniref:Inhibitor of apoptosis-promoting Bax1 protein n=1 Tax=Paramecium primaurelia TaxID=5886 RepID=A0A8S1L1D5_PARPR|nr:unnamed protein product [Paramecium primaurelia]
MYNNSNQDYYQYNQNNQQQYQQQQYQQQQQQYYNPQAFDTQDGKVQKMNDNYGYLADFQDAYIRADFVKKVYTLLTLELLITLVMIALGLYTGMAFWLVQLEGGFLTECFYSGYGPIICNTGYYLYPAPTWLFYVSFFAALILQCMLYCGGNIARKAPTNYVVLLLYIIFFGFTLTTFCILMAIYWGQAIVWQAWGITFVIVFALTLYACKTKTDFSFKIGAIFILCPTILMLVIMSCIWWSAVIYILLCTLFIVFYGFYLIWETQLIMGKGKLKLSIDDYVIGSLLLYATIIQLFLRIIEILAIARGK